MVNNWTNESVLKAIQEQFETAVVSNDESFGIMNIEVLPEQVHTIIEWVKNHESLKVNFLTNITAIHYPENKGREMVLVYHLHSWSNNFRFRLKTYLPIEQPSIATVTDLFAAADWIERETFDFYGVQFIGHPNLTRILNEDSMDYFPLRKEYHLEDQTRQDKDNRFFGR